MATKFNVGTQEHNIALNYYSAAVILPDKFAIDLLEMFTDQQKMVDTMQGLILDELTALRLMFYYMEDSTPYSWEDFLKAVTSQEITKFREAFWDEVCFFMGPIKAPILRQMWTEFLKEIKTADFVSLTSKISALDSPPEESTSGG